MNMKTVYMMHEAGAQQGPNTRVSQVKIVTVGCRLSGNAKTCTACNPINLYQHNVCLPKQPVLIC